MKDTSLPYKDEQLLWQEGKEKLYFCLVPCQDGRCLRLYRCCYAAIVHFCMMCIIVSLSRVGCVCCPNFPNVKQFFVFMRKINQFHIATVEWEYGRLQQTWSAMTFKAILRTRVMNVGDMYLLAMILTNAHCTMHGNGTSEYFNMLPPSFAQWVAEGPRQAP